MVSAACTPFTQILPPTAGREPLDVASELSDLLDVLQQCRARGVSVSDEFLAYVDTLLDEVDTMQIFGRIHAA